MHEYVWLAIAFPLMGALINGLFGRVINNKLISGIIGCTALGLSFAVAVGTFFSFRGMTLDEHETGVPVHLWKWIYSGNLKIDAELLVDPLSITMLLFVTGISFLIHIYSTGYMSHDKGYARFFTYLNLFVGMMLILILAGNGLVMFVGWEGVGLCSYLLIGFWYKDMFNAKCGMKAFVVNRIGDFGVLTALFLIFMYFRDLNFTRIFAAAPGVFETNASWVPLVIGIFLLLGAAGKSAQLPLHIWLPDAMAGPTPVSALIHAATMVTAGVYMVARFNPIFSANPTAGMIVAVVGCATAFVAATIALTQNDIKKVLAYSTVSQLGYMFLACGVGAYWVAIFHVVTHAFFKACLFLGSGSVIHGMHEEQDTRYMGGLAKFMPWTYATFVISTLAIAGIVPFAGFFSKDEILWKVYSWQAHFGPLPMILYLVALLTAFMTAFYMGRVTWKTFLGKPRFTEEFVEKHKHPLESGPAMVMPLVVLAFLATIGGFLMFVPSWAPGAHHSFRDFVGPSTGVVATAEHASVFEDSTILASGAGAGVGTHTAAEGAGHGGDFPKIGGSVTATEIALAVVSVVLALIALFVIALPMYTSRFGSSEPFKKSLKPLYLFSLNKWYIDEFFHTVLVIPGVAFSYMCWKIIDIKIIDGIVNGSAWVVGEIGLRLRPVQTGYVRNYALMILLGAVIYLLYNLIK